MSVCSQCGTWIVSYLSFDGGVKVCEKCHTDNLINTPALPGIHPPKEMCRECSVCEVDPPPLCAGCWSKTRAAKSTPDLSHKIAPEAGPGSDHYTAHAITPMEYVKGMGRSEYRGACVLNVIKYVTRFHLKGTPMRDLEKARWYIEQLIAAQKEWEQNPEQK